MVDIECFSANVDEGQANLTTQILPSTKETNLSIYGNVVSGTMML